MTLAISICATKNYTYAMGDQARRVIANLGDLDEPGHIILTGDDSPELKRIVELYQRMSPEGWQIHHIESRNLNDDAPNYKEAAQLLIAQLRSEAFSFARALKSDYCWSLDSDTLPPPNALRCMRQMLEFDNGYYGVSSCPYPNQLFLGGRGVPQQPIMEDFLPNERVLPDGLKGEWEQFEQDLKDASAATIAELQKRGEELQKQIRECPPDGNIWEVIAKHGWRRRGWLDFAYPGIGRGAVVPSDWCGFGCTLLGKEALANALFDGYDGKGTEDLYIVWKRWFPAGIRINVITHCPCDHVIWEKKKQGDPSKYTLLRAYHETEGEYSGHLRIRSVPVRAENGFLFPA